MKSISPAVGKLGEQYLLCIHQVAYNKRPTSTNHNSEWVADRSALWPNIVCNTHRSSSWPQNVKLLLWEWMSDRKVGRLLGGFFCCGKKGMLRNCFCEGNALHGHNMLQYQVPFGFFLTYRPFSLIGNKLLGQQLKILFCFVWHAPWKTPGKCVLCFCTASQMT